MNTTQLTGHETEETAYIVEDWPYGRRLRCRKAFWIETNKRGQRLVTRTTNPKRGDGTSWNKPKRSTYSDLLILAETDEGKTITVSLSPYATLEEVESFHAKWGEGFTEWQLARWQVMLAAKRVGERLTYVVVTNETEETKEARKKASKNIHRAVAFELRGIQNEA